MIEVTVQHDVNLTILWAWMWLDEGDSSEDSAKWHRAELQTETEGKSYQMLVSVYEASSETDR